MLSPTASWLYSWELRPSRRLYVKLSLGPTAARARMGVAAAEICARVFQYFVGSYTLRSAVVTGYSHQKRWNHERRSNNGVNGAVFVGFRPVFGMGTLHRTMTTDIDSGLSKFPEICGLVLW